MSAVPPPLKLTLMAHAYKKSKTYDESKSHSHTHTWTMQKRVNVASEPASTKQSVVVLEKKKFKQRIRGTYWPRTEYKYVSMVRRRREYFRFMHINHQMQPFTFITVIFEGVRAHTQSEKFKCANKSRSIEREQHRCTGFWRSMPVPKCMLKLWHFLGGGGKPNQKWVWNEWDPYFVYVCVALALLLSSLVLLL